MIIELKFSESWLYGDGGVHSFAVSRFINMFTKAFDGEQIELLEKGLNRCSIKVAGADAERLKTEVLRILTEELSAKEENIYELSIHPEDQPGPSAEPAATGTSAFEEALRRAKEGADPADVPQKENEEDVLKILEQVDALVGAEAFKALCHSVADQAPLIHAHHTEDVFLSQTYLFVIGAGEGFTRSTDLFADLLRASGLLSTARVWERELPPYEYFKDPVEMDKMVESLKKGSEQAKGMILSYDLSGWLGHTSHSMFKKILQMIFDNPGKCVTVFRIPNVSERQLQETEKDLKDILSMKTVRFPTFSFEEQLQLIEGMLSRYDFTVEKGVWEILGKKIAEEKADGLFYGIRTLEKLSNEMIRCTEAANAAEKDIGRTITSEKLEELLPKAAARSQTAEAEFNSLIGMKEVKEEVFNIIRQIELAKAEHRGLPSMHMCFTGNPGTGKTTVARLLGEMLYEKGLLRVGRFFEYRGRDLCGRYVGETAVKTTEICRQAYGSILFIDEAYSLFRGSQDSNDYGREALDTLIAEMENHSDDLIVIFAGYSEDMERMLTGNSGMRSRIPYTLHFPDYSRDELCQIFMRRIPENYKYDDVFAAAVKKYFAELPDEIFGKDFGNGRFVRNLYERMSGKALARHFYEGAEDHEYILEDFEAAVRELSHSEEQHEKNKKRRIGF